MSTRTLAEWDLVADPAAALAHAVPHAVVSQVLRPVVAAMIPPWQVDMDSPEDERICITSLTLVLPDVHRHAHVPPSIIEYPAQLPHLTELNFDTAAVPHDVLARLSTIPHLSVLTLNNCGNFDMFAAKHLSGVRTLETLTLFSWKKASAACTTHLAALPELRVLNLSYSHLDAPSLAPLARAPSLRKLILDSGGAGDHTGWEQISKIPCLEDLDMTATGTIDAASIAYLSQAPHLTRLDLSRTTLNKDCFAGLATIPALEVLIIATCKGVSPSGLSHLISHENLRSLNATSCRNIGSQCMAVIGQIERLHCLMLHHCAVSSEDLVHVMKLRRLRTIGLLHTNVDDAGLRLVSTLPKLTRLIARKR